MTTNTYNNPLKFYFIGVVLNIKCNDLHNLIDGKPAPIKSSKKGSYDYSILEILVLHRQRGSPAPKWWRFRTQPVWFQAILLTTMPLIRYDIR